MNRVLTAILITSTLIFAQPNNYISIGFGKSKSNSYTIPKESDNEITIRYGYELFNFLGIEARGEFFASGGKRLEHIISYGIFLKPNIDLYSRINLYGLYGYTRNILSKKSKTHSDKDTTIQDDFSYGGGLEYGVNQNNLFLYADYIRYIDKSTTNDDGKYAIKIDTLSLGLTMKFGLIKNKTKNKSKYPTLPMNKPKQISQKVSNGSTASTHSKDSKGYQGIQNSKRKKESKYFQIYGEFIE